MAKRRSRSRSASRPRPSESRASTSTPVLDAPAPVAPPPTLDKPRRTPDAPTQTPDAPPATRDAPSWTVRALLFLALLGVACRFVGLNWDETTGLHPDERFVAQTITEKMSWPSSVGEYFDTARSPLNPFNRDSGLFVYGQLPLFTVKAVAQVTQRDSYDGVMLVGRALSAIYSALTVLVLFFAARRASGLFVGALSASLLACSAIDIQQAHFFVTDTFASFWTACAFWAALGARSVEAGARWRASAWAGAFLGLAVASKVSSGLFLVALLPLLWLECTRQDDAGTSRETVGATRKTAVGALLVAVVCASFVFRIGHPVAFRGESSWVSLGGLLDVRAPLATVLPGGREGYTFAKSLQEQADISAGRADPPWNLQWVGRRDFVWPARNLWGWGMGPFWFSATLLGLFGVAVTLWNARRPARLPEWAKPSPAILASAGWIVLAFLFYGGQYSKFTRYYLAITPFAALCAAWALDVVRQATAQRERQTSRATWAVLGAVPLFTGLWALAVTSIYARPHTRLEATRWIADSIPDGTTVANESSWDDSLPWRISEPLTSINLELYDGDDIVKREALLDKLDQTEWIFISSARVWGSIPRLPDKWPMTTAYYRALFDGTLGFRAAKQFTSYPSLGIGPLRVAFPDDSYEEGLLVYDHPRVILFQKTPSYSRARAEEILSESLLSQRRDVPLPELVANGYAPDEATLPTPPAPR